MGTKRLTRSTRGSRNAESSFRKPPLGGIVVLHQASTISWRNTVAASRLYAIPLDETRWPSVLLAKFVVLFRGLGTNFAGKKDTSNSLILVWLLIQKSATEAAESMVRTSESPH